MGLRGKAPREAAHTVYHKRIVPRAVSPRAAHPQGWMAQRPYASFSKSEPGIESSCITGYTERVTSMRGFLRGSSAPPALVTRHSTFVSSPPGDLAGPTTLTAHAARQRPNFCERSGNRRSPNTSIERDHATLGTPTGWMNTYPTPSCYCRNSRNSRAVHGAGPPGAGPPGAGPPGAGPPASPWSNCVACVERGCLSLHGRVSVLSCNAYGLD